MSFEMFRDSLEEQLRSAGGEGLAVSFEQIVKNNGVRKEAVLLKGSGDPVCPTIYLDVFYEDYEHGAPIRQIAQRVLRQYDTARSRVHLPEGFFEEYASVAGRMFCRLVNRERNCDLLSRMPWQPWQDLAVTVYYQLKASVMPDAMIQIRTDYLERWSISEEQLFADAWKNTREKTPVCFRKLSNVLREYDSSLEADEEGIAPLYLLTNTRKNMGAVCIADEQEGPRIREKLGCSYYVLPSSIHECLILPDTGEFCPSDLNAMVREINRTQVEAQEVLSDHVYYYDGNAFSMKL